MFTNQITLASGQIKQGLTPCFTKERKGTYSHDVIFMPGLKQWCVRYMQLIEDPKFGIVWSATGFEAITAQEAGVMLTRGPIVSYTVKGKKLIKYSKKMLLTHRP